jgi:hypothetical protein
MSKPKLFIGSSSENVEISYAVQENLEQDFEVTVWNQAVFELSRSTLESLDEKAGDYDGAAFIFSPDDVAQVRGEAKNVIRDNVIFELGLFIGRLGRERTFMIIPRGTESLHLPSDLLGIAAATYDGSRSDGNWKASLGPACNQIRNAFKSSEARSKRKKRQATPLAAQEIVAVLNSWLGHRPATENRKVLYFENVDQELGLPAGSALQYLEEAAAEWYEVKQKGPNLIQFKERPYDFGPSRADELRKFF